MVADPKCKDQAETREINELYLLVYWLTKGDKGNSGEWMRSWTNRYQREQLETRQGGGKKPPS